MKHSVVTILLFFLFSCESTSEVNYPDVTKDYHIKIDFSPSDGTNPLSYTTYVDTIHYKIVKLAEDSNDIARVFSGVQLEQNFILKDDIYIEGRFSGHFSWKDANGIELYHLKTATDTLIRKDIDHSLEWRVQLKRRTVKQQLISDSLLHSDFKFLSLRYSNTNLDSIFLDSVSLINSSVLLNSIYSGDYKLEISAFFKNDTTPTYQRDSTISSILIGLNSDTTKTHLNEFLH